MKKLIDAIKGMKALNRENLDKSVYQYLYMLNSNPKYLKSLNEMLTENTCPIMDKHFNSVLKYFDFSRSIESFTSIFNEFIKNSTIDFNKWNEGNMSIEEAVKTLLEKFAHNIKYKYNQIRVKGDDVLLMILKAVYDSCNEYLKAQGEHFMSIKDIGDLCCKSRSLLWTQIDKVMVDDDKRELEKYSIEKFGYEDMFKFLTGFDETPKGFESNSEFTEILLCGEINPDIINTVNKIYEKYKK